MLKQRIRAGQCGVNRVGRRFCVLPDIGSRLVPDDFDAEEEGFEVIAPPEPPEQPVLVPAVDDGGDFQAALGALIRREVRRAVADGLEGIREEDDDCDLDDDADDDDDDDDDDEDDGGWL